MTWKRAADDDLYRCGNCGSAIAKGNLVAFTRAHLVRCESCARQIEEPPDVIDDEAQAGVPEGVRHQPSMGFSGERNRMVSSGELARRHVTRHIERRRR